MRKQDARKATDPILEDAPATKMRRNVYETEFAALQGELIELQEWVKAAGAKVCILFEGRDTAGKGGTIKRIDETGQPPVFRVVTLPATPDRQSRRCTSSPTSSTSPQPGRSSSSIAAVQPRRRGTGHRVLRAARDSQVPRADPAVEKAMVDNGIILVKYWLEVSADEQTRQIESRNHDPRKLWKQSEMDLKSYGSWCDYSRARDAMLAASDTAWAPWFVAHTDDKKRARLNTISHVLSQIPCTEPVDTDVTLPKRQRPDGYRETALPLRFIPTPF